MSQNAPNLKSPLPEVTVEDVNRVLDLGRLLLSVLNEGEIEQLRETLNHQKTGEEIGNAGIT